MLLLAIAGCYRRCSVARLGWGTLGELYTGLGRQEILSVRVPFHVRREKRALGDDLQAPLTRGGESRFRQLIRDAPASQ